MPIEHIVQPGDCIWSIAFENGLFWQTVWDHPGNAALKEKRGTGFQLQPGDIVVVPDKRLKEVSKPSEAKHTFTFKGVPAVLNIAIMRHPAEEDEEEAEDDAAPDNEADSNTFEDEPEEDLPEEPAAEIDYRLEIGVRVVTGKTDGEGKLKVYIMPNDREGRLILEPGTPRERAMDLMLGHLDPINTPAGIAHRLSNLGFAPPRHDADIAPPELSDAIAAFQRANDLEMNGQPDENTLKKLQQIHGS